jgi:hypothetical protein
MEKRVETEKALQSKNRKEDADDKDVVAADLSI